MWHDQGKWFEDIQFWDFNLTFWQLIMLHFYVNSIRFEYPVAKLGEIDQFSKKYKAKEL